MFYVLILAFISVLGLHKFNKTLIRSSTSSHKWLLLEWLEWLWTMRCFWLTDLNQTLLLQWNERMHNVIVVEEFSTWRMVLVSIEFEKLDVGFHNANYTDGCCPYICIQIWISIMHLDNIFARETWRFQERSQSVGSLHERDEVLLEVMWIWVVFAVLIG